MVIVDEMAVSDYHSYLALDELLALQQPRSDEHDELLFVVAHQVHELWFKLLRHELDHLQKQFVEGAATGAIHTLRRAVGILRALTAPTEVFETLTPRQFNSFRHKLGGSGAQSAQFRQIEAVLGRRDPRMFETFQLGGRERTRIEADLRRPTVYDALLRFLGTQGYEVPRHLLERDVTRPLEPSPELQEVLLQVYLDDTLAAQVCDRLIEIDQGVQEWRYRHVALAARIIGDKPGTGGTSGAPYLRTTLFHQLYPDLWAVRSRL
ncbi:tryptophan 2,3-dioxygenase [Actinomadura sp. 7K534]|nr:tryptophan 2,3-dioxygenase [Actinomadura sp. 7K534]